MYSLIIDVLVSFLLGSMVFFAGIVAPSIHRSLDKEQSGKLLRAVFPGYFMWGIILSAIILAVCVFHSPKGSVLIGFVLVGFIYSRFWLRPRVNVARDKWHESDSPQHKAHFYTLHRQSVIISVLQMLMLFTIIIA